MHVKYIIFSFWYMSRHILVEEDSGADNELEDVFQGFHGLQQLFRQLLCIVHVILQDFGQLPKKNPTKTNAP